MINDVVNEVEFKGIFFISFVGLNTHNMHTLLRMSVFDINKINEKSYIR